MTAVVVRLLVLRVFTTGNVRENAEATTKFVVATPKVCISCYGKVRSVTEASKWILASQSATNDYCTAGNSYNINCF